MKRRYHSINDVLKKRFGERTYKVMLDTGATCPNRDGALATAGCVFCNEQSYYPATDDKPSRTQHSISQQLEEGVAYARQRHDAEKFIAYFQRGSHTYGPLDTLTSSYEATLNHPDVVGLAISTRPDCLSEALCDTLAQIATKTMLWVELGLQSAHDTTLAHISRGHTVQDFIAAHARLRTRNIHTCAHIIVGLPGETGTQMIETAQFLARKGIWGVKIHNLHVLTGTKLEQMYQRNEVIIPTLEEYAGIVVDMLEHLPSEMVIHRINSHSPRRITVAPKWLAH